MNRTDDPGITPVVSVSPVEVTSVAPNGMAETFRAVRELTKPRITRLVTITAAVGFAMAAMGRATWFTWDLLLAAVGALIGTALSASGANALNQWAERDRDARMPRTCGRPLPLNKVAPTTALGVGIGLCLSGVLTLFALAGPAAALVSASTIALYLFFYTPLKPVTTVATIIGAVPGALPPLIGWCAAAANPGENMWAPLLQPGGWSLFLLMFVWQIPHFLAIAWMYRDDYAKGGYRMLPLLDPSGRHTAWTILLWAAALIPATLAPSIAMPDRLGAVYPLFALLSGVAYLILCVRLAREHSRPNARRVFLASIMHLPLLLVVMVADALVTNLI